MAREEDVLITIGIQPSFASTGYGYIEAGSCVRQTEKVEFYRASRFVEKPDHSTASSYVQSGKYYWNSGMFIWSVDAIESAFRAFQPPLARLMEELISLDQLEEVEKSLHVLYEPLTKISIDYAVMEKAKNILMVKGLFYWDDVGSWTALVNHFPADANNNVVIGDSELIESSRNIVYSKEHLTALLGVEDLIVVQAPGVTLVSTREKAQEVKKLVQQLALKHESSKGSLV